MLKQNTCSTQNRTHVRHKKTHVEAKHIIDTKYKTHVRHKIKHMLKKNICSTHVKAKHMFDNKQNTCQSKTHVLHKTKHKLKYKTHVEAKHMFDTKQNACVRTGKNCKSYVQLHGRLLESWRHKLKAFEILRNVTALRYR